MGEWDLLFFTCCAGVVGATWCVVTAEIAVRADRAVREPTADPSAVHRRSARVQQWYTAAFAMSAGVFVAGFFGGRAYTDAAACSTSAAVSPANLRAVPDGRYDLRAILASDHRPETPMCYLVMSAWSDDAAVVEPPITYASYESDVCTSMAAAFISTDRKRVDVYHVGEELHLTLGVDGEMTGMCPDTNNRSTHELPTGWREL